MVTPQWFCTVILVLGILLKTNSVNGSRNSCPPPAVVDLTEETPDSSGTVNKSGVLFPREAIQYDDDGRFGCMCDIRVCAPYCCPYGLAASLNGCVEDKYQIPVSKSEQSWDVNKIYTFVYDPCQLSSISSIWTKKYDSARDLPYDKSVRKYCFLRDVNTMKYDIGSCLDGRSILGYKFSRPINAWGLTGTFVRVLFILVTLIVYSVKPELKNLQGLILRCYIGSELIHHALFYVCYTLIAGATEICTILLLITGIVESYFDTATAFWLTIMNFDVWCKFRRFRSNRRTNVKEYERNRFLRYSIFTWCGSTIVTVIRLGCIVWNEVADPLTDSTVFFSNLTSGCTVILIYIICIIFSIYTFSSMALSIWRQKKEIARAVNDVDRHQADNTNQQRINLYPALFTLMGCYKMFTIVSWFWDHPIYQKFCLALGMLHGILTFFIFVWKDDVKRSFRSQVTKMFPKLCAFRRPDTTPAIENRNENL